MLDKRIPFTKPTIIGAEIESVAQCLASGAVNGGGKYTKKVCSILEKITQSPHAKFLNSCTAALETIFLALNVGYGDEVIMPSFTFTSTANAVALRGATPVFVDVKPSSMNINPNLVESAITHNTKAILVVHYAGCPCNMDAIMNISLKHNIPVIEDAAQCIGTFYKGRHLGTIGAMGAISFHATKNINCGEGGALLINDPQYIDAVEVAIEKGTNRTAYTANKTDKYVWLDLGSSHVASEVSAAFLFSQLREWRKITEKRRFIWNEYHRLFQREKNLPFKLPSIQDDAEHNGHIYFVVLDEAIERANLITRLAKKNVQVTSHYEPLHSSPAGVKFCRVSSSLRITEKQSKQLVRLPIWYGMSAQDANKVARVFIQSCEELLQRH